MKKLISFYLLLNFALCSLSLCWADEKPDHNPPQTLRVDYYHTGNALSETFSLHQLVIEPQPWSVHPDQYIDTSNSGSYFFEILEPVTNKVLYSRGFTPVFIVWQATAEAKKMHRTFHESVRFPMPEKPVKLRLSKRNKENQFAAIWYTAIDPNDMMIQRRPPPPVGEVLSILDSGAPIDKVDLLIIGDGYTEAENKKFHNDAKRVSKALFASSPFKERKGDFNVWAINPPSVESGSNRPSSKTYRWSPTGTTYDAFGAERFILAFDNLGLRNIAQQAPYEFIMIILNSETYGGGGLFSTYSTVSMDNEWADYLVVHEFGHHFAGLADEYFTSAKITLSKNIRPEPWQHNVTAMHDPNNIKWKHLITPATPLSTPWPQKEFMDFQKANQAKRKSLRDENRPESEMSQLFKDESAYIKKLFNKAEYKDRIGAFEGAFYESSGYYRSELNCMMFTRSAPFCHVCKETIHKIIDLYSR